MNDTNQKTRINKIIDAVMRVARGDYSTQIELSEKNDDLDSLSMGINMMIDDIKSNLETEAQNKRFKKINSELKEAIAKAEESDHLKSAFLANMSHEIRTPLNSILGFSDLLELNLDQQTFENYLTIITNSGNQLLQIINDILDISKIDSNQLRVHKEPCAVNQLLIEVYQMNKHTKKLEENTALQLYPPLIDNHSDICLDTDPLRLKQVLNNLINNAIKHTNKGHIEFGYSLIEHEKEGFIEFFVRDTGVGILEEQLDAIFERFIQVGESKVKEGNGLGLSICKGLSDLLGGELKVESEYEKGSCFYLTLPMCTKSKQLLLNEPDGDEKTLKLVKP